MIVFGPIPSRRLGRSLGINNIPHKHCSYSCTYCQIGTTDVMTCRRREYYPPVELFDAVKSKTEQLKYAGEKIDYVTFVPDGEPTLDVHIGESIRSLKSLGYPIAVITNASLLPDRSVQIDLMAADWVSVKIDTAKPRIWDALNRPHGALVLNEIIDGVKTFSSRFTGKLVTETMLVNNVNDGINSLRATADLIRQVNPSKAYILIPTRPPAVPSVIPADPSAFTAAYQTFTRFGINTELIVNTEGSNFTFCSNIERELMNIVSVHPMRKDAVMTFLSKSHSGWDVIEKLVKEGKVEEVKYQNEFFIVSTFKSSSIS